jgi:hypothetical protein
VAASPPAAQQRPKPVAALPRVDPPPPGPVTEREALARIIRSEAGSHTVDEKIAVAWVARNRARKKAISIARMVCSPTCGPGGGGRPMSSRLAPRQNDYALADVVLAASPSDDPTHGAWDAFEPKLQDQLRGKDGRHWLSAAEVRKSWLKSNDYYGTVGRWELYGPQRVARKPAKPSSAKATGTPI